MIEKILEFDRQLFLLLNFDGSPFWDNFFWAVTGRVIWVPLYLFIVWLIYRKVGVRNTIIAVLCIAMAVILSDHICTFFKVYVPKLRPTHNPKLVGLIELVKNYRGGLTGTVSAHAATAFAVAVFSSLIIRSNWYTYPMIFWALLVSYSRIYVSAHYPLDLFWGAIVGSTLALLLMLFYTWSVTKLDLREKKNIDR